MGKWNRSFVHPVGAANVRDTIVQMRELMFPATQRVATVSGMILRESDGERVS
jgi:hypothetical protein